MRDRDEQDERNRGEFSGGGELGGPYARDAGWSGGGARDDYTRDPASGYRGKGPKGDERPDARIEEAVNAALTEADDVDATDIVISVSNGEVTLTGIVSSRAMKRRAEDVAERCSGVRDIFNNLRIQNDEEFQMGKARE
jgi:hypothetical protein